MNDVQPHLLQKPESTTDACSDSDFERGLEELMRGHLDDCMSFASCSSPNGEDDESESDQLVRRRRRSDLEGDDLAETSAAKRRQSRILSRWAARQAQEMITTIERRNRESELMALAGLHTVSMLESSFLKACCLSKIVVDHLGYKRSRFRAQIMKLMSLKGEFECLEEEEGETNHQFGGWRRFPVA